MNIGKIQEAAERIKPFVKQTPIVSSELLNSWFGHEICFKLESVQKTGSFKIRGASNAILNLPDDVRKKGISAVSSGNHAQAVAFVAKQLGIPATIFMTEFASQIKKQAVLGYGAEVVVTKTRQEANRLAKENDGYFIHPYDNDFVIAGQATACYEALSSEFVPDAVFAPCGGGGLLSGTYLAVKGFSNEIKVFGCEPKIANDAAQSVRDGRIFSFDDTQMTIADGLRAMCVSDRTFGYIKQVDGIFESEEKDIIYWVQWLNHLLKIYIEPSSAICMDGVMQWIKSQKPGKKGKILVIISGGNLDHETNKLIWQENYLNQPPAL